VILAAGEGKRMKSEKPKVLHEVLFKPMVLWVADAARAAGASELCFVTGFKNEEVEKALEGQGVFALQREQRGTAHAVLSARRFLEEHIDFDVAILAGDVPLISAKTLSDALCLHREQDNAATVISAKLEDPAGYGRIIRSEDGTLKAIVEEKDATEEQKRICEANSGAYWFKCSALLSALDRVACDNSANEYYLPDAVGILVRDGQRVGAFTARDPREILGANDRRQLYELNRIARDMVIDRLFDAGVNFEDLSGVIIGPDVTIGADTTVLPGTIIRGKSVLGKRCVIGPGSLIENSTVGDATTVNASQVYDSTIGKGCRIGPFAHLRPGNRLADLVKTGNFVELKNAVIGSSTSVAHLSYIGDAWIGNHCNIGCGTITVNYDGKAKHLTKIGDNSFIGCNSNLVAPVTIESDTYIACGSTITRNVPQYALAVARERQKNIEGWVKKRREDKEK